MTKKGRVVVMMRLFSLLSVFWIQVILVSVSLISVSQAQSLYPGADLQKVVEFSLASHNPDKAIAKVETANQVFTIELTPASIIGAANWDDQNTEDQIRKNMRFFNGHLLNDPASWARVSIYGEHFYGLIKYDDKYLTLSNYNERAIGPDLRTLYDKVTERTVAAYTNFDDFMKEPDTEGGSFNTVLPIGIVVDHYYNEEFDGAGVAHALGVVNATDGIFRENLELALKVEAVVQTVDEDFSLAEGATTDQLRRFRTFRQSVPELTAELGLVHLFSNAPKSGTVIGRAYLSTVCQTNGLDVGISLAYPLSAQLMAHELGHNLGAHHDTIEGCENGPRRIMYPYINTSREFSSCSLDKINALRNATTCFLDVIELAFEARLIDGNLILQVSNLSDTLDAEAVAVKIDRQANLTSNLPATCAVSGDEIVCDIPLLKAGETVDISIPLNGVANGLITAWAEGAQNSYESDLTDNTAIVDLADFTDDRDGLCVDPDGDGFGWNGTNSCRTKVKPLDDTEQRPEFINVQTGIPVNFVQAYWNPAEMVGQVIECIPHFWSSDDRFYKKDDSLIRRYRHELADGQSNSGTVQVATFARSSETGDLKGTSVDDFEWSISNGRYAGPAPIERSSFIQIVDEAGTRYNATRSWTSNISFDLCTSFPDTSGYFVPSGTLNKKVAGVCVDTPPRNDGFGWNGIQSCKVDPDLDVTGSRSIIIKSIDDSVSIDGVLDDAAWQNATSQDTAGNLLRSGITISGLDTQLAPKWLVAHDETHLYIAIEVPDETPVSDSQRLYDDDSVELFFDAGYQRNKRYDSDDTQVILRNEGERTGVTTRPVEYTHARRYDEEEKQYIYEIKLQKSSLFLSGGEFGIEVQLNDDQDGDLRDNKWGWSAEAGKDELWFDMSTIGHACFDNGGATQNCLLGNRPPNDCIDTPPLGDGWGWNGSKSCKIECIDTDPVGDGFGWNGYDSCKIVDQPQECVDTDPVGDGWGWNGKRSCRIDTGPNTCVDTDPVGDGWGWNGTTSCKIVCVDTDPVGDGWGWNGTNSCRVGGAPGNCVDTDPVGDGWGWNGVRSCRIE